MGLTISFDFEIPSDASGAEQMVHRLRTIAMGMNFDEVQDVRIARRGKRKPSLRPKNVNDWDLVYGTHYLDGGTVNGVERWLPIPALEAFVFGINNRGAETAVIGLASHPVTHAGDYFGSPFIVETRLGGLYTWSSGCKTQYAAIPRHGGLDNFVRVHTGLVELFDAARDMGIKVDVRDDGNYWATRDRATLIQHLEEMDRLVAAITGRLKDAFGQSDAGQIIAPITTHPEFEHLEAEGRDRIKRPAKRGKKRL